MSSGPDFFRAGKSLWAEIHFFSHLLQSRLEFLKAIRSLVDDRIDELEKKKEKGKKKATKIKVE